MATKLQIRRDTASNWTSANPTLSAGELGFETDTSKLKIGNGSTAWTSLGYFVGDVTTYLAGGNVQHIIPAGNELYDLGDSDSRFRDLYLSGSTIKLGSVTLSVDSASNALVLPAGTQLGNVAVLDSAGVQNVINQTYVRNNQIQYNTADFADSAFVTAQINNLIDAAPGALNTLNELAAALGDDANFSTTITNQIAGKLDSAATTTLIDSSYVQARQTTGGSVDSAATISLINSNTNSGFSKFKYTATANQTVFQDSDADGNVLAFDPSSTIVFYNGVMLDETTDYTVGTNAITLTSGADSGVSLSIVKFGVGYTPPAFPWGGDRGLTASANGNADNGYDVIDYFTIATTNNATDFGDLQSGIKGLPDAVGSSNRVIFAGGKPTGSYSNEIGYVTPSTPGNTTDFGDLTQARQIGASTSNGTIGCFQAGWLGSRSSTIDYITIATTGNASSFGTCSAQSSGGGGAADATRGLFQSGYKNTTYNHNEITYITFASPGNAQDFGDLTAETYYMAGCSDTTRGVFTGGADTTTNIEYVTIQTTGNATDFGDLHTGRSFHACVSDNTYGNVAGGGTSNQIQAFTIQTPGNATDAGDLTVARDPCGASGNSS